MILLPQQIQLEMQTLVSLPIPTLTVSAQLFYPNSGAMRDVLQALDTDNRLDLIPEIWKGGCEQ